jgi:glycosyltransferase involved in cell wall biosynthesis
VAIDLRTAGRMLYVSPADVSVGNGPGVNENEFIHALHAAVGDRAHFLVPRPVEPVDDLPGEALTFCAPHRRYRPWRFPFHVISQIRAAGRLLRERRFDLFVFRIDVFPFVPFYLTRRHRLPYVIKTLGTGALDALEKRGALARLLAPLNRAMFRSIVSRALVADTDSDGHAIALRQRLALSAREIVWIDNAVNTGRFFPVPPQQARKELGLERFDPLLGYVGSRPWERGGAQLLEAAARIVPQHPSLGVLIVGAGEPVEGMKRRAAELGIAERCHFAGYVPYRRIPRVVQSLDVGVSISLAPERAVNSELKVRQYLACGKPIVVSPGGNEFVTEQGFGTVVEPGDLSAITAALARWLALAPVERDAFAARAARYMHEHLSMAVAIDRRLRLWSERMPQG